MGLRGMSSWPGCEKTHQHGCPHDPGNKTQETLGFRSLPSRSIARRSWNVTCGLMAESWAVDSGGGDVPIGNAAGSDSIVGSGAAIAFVRRRMRAVTGSSAVECFCRTRCGV